MPKSRAKSRKVNGEGRPDIDLAYERGMGVRVRRMHGELLLAKARQEVLTLEEVQRQAIRRDNLAPADSSLSREVRSRSSARARTSQRTATQKSVRWSGSFRLQRALPFLREGDRCQLVEGIASGQKLCP